MTPDHINAAFEGAAAVILWLNVRRLCKDRELKGVSVLPTVLYFVWCLWNLYYYAHLGQVISWYAGFGVGAANLTWVVLALWFRHRSRQVHIASGEVLDRYALLYGTERRWFETDADLRARLLTITRAVGCK